MRTRYCQPTFQKRAEGRINTAPLQTMEHILNGISQEAACLLVSAVLAAMVFAGVALLNRYPEVAKLLRAWYPETVSPRQSVVKPREAGLISSTPDCSENLNLF